MQIWSMAASELWALMSELPPLAFIRPEPLLADTGVPGQPSHEHRQTRRL